MKIIVDAFQKHKATFIISLLSAVLAVVLQFSITAVISRDTTDGIQGIYLEDATGYIMSQVNQTVTSRGSNILQKGDIALFQTGQVVEDEMVKKHIQKQEFMITSLIVPLDVKGRREGDNRLTKDLGMQLTSVGNSSMSLCESLRQSGKSCVTYLTNKYAQSIPVELSLSGGQTTGKTTLSIRYPIDVLPYSGLFLGKPIELDIRPL